MVIEEEVPCSIRKRIKSLRSSKNSRFVILTGTFCIITQPNSMHVLRWKAFFFTAAFGNDHSYRYWFIHWHGTTKFCELIKIRHGKYNVWNVYDSSSVRHHLSQQSYVIKINHFHPYPINLKSIGFQS